MAQQTVIIFVIIVFLCADAQPGSDVQNQVVSDGAANVEDMNLPGKDSSFFKKISF